MTNINRFGGKVENAKNYFLKHNFMANKMDAEEKLDAFCKWCDKETVFLYYAVRFDKMPKDFELKFMDFTSVINFIKNISTVMRKFVSTKKGKEIYQTLNEQSTYALGFNDDYGDVHFIYIDAVYASVV